MGAQDYIEYQAQHANHKIKVSFTGDVFEIAPDLAVGLIVVPQVANTDRDDEVQGLLKHMEREITESGLEKSTISQLPSIAAWRQVYSQFGAKPAKYPCAAESLLKRVIEHGSLPRVHTIVDLCNAIALKSRTPIAACDIQGIQELTIRKATGSEPYLPIGKPEEPEMASEGEIIYADEFGRAHSRRWNWRQSDSVKVTRESSSMLFTVEAVHKEAKVLVEATTNLLFDLLHPFSSGPSKIAFGFISAETPTFEYHFQERGAN
ncbi:B3/4 domain-containing protein [Paenibacillus sp. GCM10027627]|uniref:B3/B4 domain-containing protein n=1 Tax=unclassified Paenibacillus TaxID=185978 RepID=UPI003629A667